MKTLWTMVFVLILLSSCKRGESNFFCEECEIVIDKTAPIELVSEVIIHEDSLLSPNDITLLDDKLIITSLDNTSAIFNVFTNNGQHITDFGTIGKADNEFTFGAKVTQVEGHDFYVNDVNTCSLKKMNIDSIIDSKVCVISKSIKTAPRALNAFIVDDTLLIYEQETFDNYELFRDNISKSTNNPAIKLYAPRNSPSDYYQSKMSYNKNNNMIVAAMKNSNQVNFLNINTGFRRAVRITNGNEYSRDGDKQRYQYYCGITTNSQYVYALYMNQTLDDAFEKRKNMCIHVFDWKGNYIKSLQTKDYIIKISVDKKNEWMYALDNDGRVYRYPLKN